MAIYSEKATPQDYRTLGLEPGTPPDEVKKAYRGLVKRWHPDIFLHRPHLEHKRAEEKFKEINGAYRRISTNWKTRENAEEVRDQRADAQAAAHTSTEASKAKSRESRSTGGPGTAEARSTGASAARDSGAADATATKRRYGRASGLGVGTFIDRSGKLARKALEALGNTARKAWQGTRRGYTSLSAERRQALAAALLLLLIAMAVIQTVSTPSWLRLTPSPEVTTLPGTPPETGTESRRTEKPEAEQAPGEIGQPQTGDPATVPRLPKKHAMPRTSPAPAEGSYFTLGSSQAEVLRVQGVPTHVRGQTWVFNLAEVHFKNGKVTRYNNFDGTLRVRLLATYQPEGEPPDYFTLGSTRNEVLLVQGTPTRVEPTKWFFGFSVVQFQEDRVESYDNYFGNLKIRVLPAGPHVGIPGQTHFTIGSSRDDVLSIQGTPTSIQGNFWFYQLSSVLFREGKVQHVSNIAGNLRFMPAPEEPERRRSGDT